MNESEKESSLMQNLKQSHDQMEIPDSSDSWKSVSVRIAESSRRSRRRIAYRIVAMFVLAAVSIGGLIEWITPTDTFRLAELGQTIRTEVLELLEEISDPDNPDGVQSLQAPYFSVSNL